MTSLSVPGRLAHVALALALLAVAPLSQSQTRPGVRPAAQPAGPTFTARQTTPSGSGLTAGSAASTTTAGQFAAGLPSPLPNPAGLAGGTAAVISTPAPLTVTPVDATAAATTAAPMDGTAAAVVTTGGYANAALAAAPAANGVALARVNPGAVGGPYTALQIAQSFLGADANRDGELTRAEFTRLAIAPYTFEDMDRNHDGIITRFEYEDAVR